MTWNLERINKEVRTITGLYADDIQDDRLNEIIQDFWRVTFPSLVKADFFKQKYVVLTRKGKAKYVFPDKFHCFNPSALCDSTPLQVTFDEGGLDSLPCKWYEEDIARPDPASNLVVHALRYAPYEASICVFSPTLLWTISSPNLTYAYSNRTISIVLDEPLGPLEPLKVKYLGVDVGHPTRLLVHPNCFELYPVPDKEYVLQIDGIRKPEPLPTVGTVGGVPSEFFDFIVYGSALKVFSLLDRNGYEKLLPIYERYESQAMATTHQHLMYTAVNGI